MNTKLKTRFQYRSLMDMTPLVDFSFSLLIFFMMSYHSSEGKISSIAVTLPKATQSVTHDKGNIVVSINDKSEVYINDVKYDINMIINEFKKIKSTNQDSVVIIRGDRKANYETIVKVMDNLNQAGIPKFTLATIKSK
jgi:biopolymer transport protein ExbD